MGYSREEYTYAGGPQDFPVNFPLGILRKEDISVYVLGETDGTGAISHRRITWPTDGLVRVTDPIPTGSTVVVQRTVEKDSLEISPDNAGPVTRLTLARAFRHMMMNIHELLDGRIENFRGGLLDIIRGYADQARTARDDSMSSAEASAQSADRAATQAEDAAGSADLAAQARDAAEAAQNNALSLKTVPASGIIGRISNALLPLVISGNGSGLTDLDASKLSKGTVPDARLPGTVVKTSGNQTIRGDLTKVGTLFLKEQNAGAWAWLELLDFEGNRSGLVFKDVLRGRIGFESLSKTETNRTAYLRNSDGAWVAPKFIGDGSGLTNLPAAEVGKAMVRLDTRDVGQCMFAQKTSQGHIEFGASISGSMIRPAGITSQGSNAGHVPSPTTGTWRCLGFVSKAYEASIFQRIA